MQRVRVTVGDRHTASMVGAHLLGEVADRTGLSSGFSAAVPWTGERAPGQDRGRLFAQVAVMLAAGGRSVADMAALRDQPELFCDVASAPTIWRAVHEVDAAVLTALRAARATAREVVWAAGGAPEEVVLDVDASLVEIHSENKEGATSHYKRGFGFHPMFCFLDATAWVPARDTNGQVRRGAQVAELDVTLDTWPPGTRAICRREKPHPGAQLRLWDHDGLRHQVVLTNSEGDVVALELRHRRHAEVENRIRNLKDCGLERMPFTAFAANAAWMELVLAAADLLAWCQLVCLDGDLARAEPRTLRYRLLHTAGRLVRRSRQVILRLPEHWPWSNDLAIAYQRLALLNT